MTDDAVRINPGDVAGLGPIPTPRRTGREPLTHAGDPVGADLAQFWAWSASDVLGNTARGVLAEFIVAAALGITDGQFGIDEGVRPDWQAWDLTTPTGIKVEVKSSAYVQTWAQTKPSIISFSTRQARAWDAVTGITDTDLRHHADVYVFALLAETDQSRIDPLELSQWQFFAVPTCDLAARAGSQQTIKLPAVTALADPVVWSELAAAVEDAGDRQRHLVRGDLEPDSPGG